MESGFTIRPSRRIVLWWAIIAAFVLGVLEFTALTIAPYTGEWVGAASLMIALAAVIGLLYSLLWQQRTEYRVHDNQLETSSGVVLQKHESFPIVRIRSLEIDSSHANGLFGLVDIDINFSGGALPDLTLLHVRRSDARKFVHEITTRRRNVVMPEWRHRSYVAYRPNARYG